MEIQTELEIEGAQTSEELRMREWQARLRALGIRPATGPWPPREFEPVKPSFYHLRRLFWRVRRHVRRLL
jgi:hypothetical protein